MEFLYQNGGTILVSIVLLLIVIFNIKKIRREKSTCGCGCETCVSREICHKDDK